MAQPGPWGCHHESCRSGRRAGGRLVAPQGEEGRAAGAGRALDEGSRPGDRGGRRGPGGADRARRRGRPRGRQPEAGGLPLALARPGRPGDAPRPAPPDRERQPSGTPDAVRTGHRPQARPLVRRPAERPPGAAPRRRQGRDRRHPHLYRTLRTDVRRPDARRGPGLRRAGRPPGQPLYRPEHRGDADDRRGRRLPRRRGRRAGQRDRGRAASRRHPGVLGRRDRRGRQALPGRAPVHARPGADQRVAGPARHAGDPGDLRASWGDDAQPRHRVRHGGDRAAVADLRREARAAGEGLPQLGAQPAPDPHPGDRERLGGERRLLRQRGRDGGLHPRPPGRVLHRARRQPAVEPRARAARRPVRGRPVHRVDAPDGRRRQLLDGHPRAPRRVRRRPEHGQRREGPSPRERRPGWT